MDNFVKLFSDVKIDHVSIGSRFYLVDSELDELRNKISLIPEHAGLFLGVKKKGFKPGFPLLDILKDTAHERIKLDKRSEWGFLCGRDIANDSFSSSASGVVLVENLHEEILGYGECGKKLLKNLFDRGDFLRRER